jgi:hypothetical protein
VVSAETAAARSIDPPRPPSVTIGEVTTFGDPHHWPDDLGDAEQGPLSHEPPTDATHPLPRVIIEASRAAGPLKAEAIQAPARAGFWGKVIECYRPGAVRDPALRGETRLKITVSKGAIRRAKTIAAMPDKAVSACIEKKLVGLEMPIAKRPTTALLKIHVAPGDEPMAPPEDAITRGPGQIAAHEVRDALVASLEPITRCHTAAREYAPLARGWLLVRIELDDTGRVSEAFETRTHFPDERLQRCILRALRKMTLVAPKGGRVRLFVPIRVDPGDAAVESAARPTPEQPAPTSAGDERSRPVEEGSQP